MRGLRLLPVVVVSLSLVPSSAVHGQDINTISPPHYGGAIIGGNPQMEWWGQTFTVPAEAFLNSVTFRYGLGALPGTTTAGNLIIRKWVAGADSGATIFSAPLVSPTLAWQDTSSLFQYTVSQTLNPGEVYVAYLAASTASPNDHWAAAFYFPSTYSGGDAVQSTDAGANWTTYTNIDMGFRADFSGTNVVPEPASVILLATGLLGVGGIGLVRRRKTSC